MPILALGLSPNLGKGKPEEPSFFTKEYIETGGRSAKQSKMTISHGELPQKDLLNDEEEDADFFRSFITFCPA
ncbi:MAG: hypothetical protein F4201_04670 [Nitrospira sp. SB0677_bin_15]|nr:hypothetical protein [Nitrospira sp. SB0667_bin_9]MYG40098.1 hypothetical protein [Nitrospira sp. SB0677_bin_15]MYH03148.1 hypothetical protein [Nitrospira sp. SB0675_bin_23]